MVLHPELVAYELQRAQAGDWIPQELRRRQASLRTVRLGLGRQQARLLEAYLAGVLDLTSFEHKRDELQRREEDVLAREREVVAQGQRLVAVQSVARSATEVLEQLARGLEQATFEQRRELVELLIDRVVVTDDAVEIRYVIPTTEASTHTRFCQLRSDYFNALADALAGRIARMPSRSMINGASPAIGVLGYVRRDAILTHRGDTCACVIRFVGAECARMKTAQLRVIQQLWHQVAISGPSRLCQLEVDHEAVAVLHQRVTHVGQLRLDPASFLGQPRLGIGRALVRRVRAFLTSEVDRRVARIIRRRLIRGRLVLRTETLQAGRSFDQRAINREVLIRQQPQCVCLAHHLIEELLSDNVAEQAPAVLAERGLGRIPAPSGSCPRTSARATGTPVLRKRPVRCAPNTG
jgi:hypothetical protein